MRASAASVFRVATVEVCLSIRATAAFRVPFRALSRQLLAGGGTVARAWREADDIQQLPFPGGRPRQRKLHSYARKSNVQCVKSTRFRRSGSPWAGERRLPCGGVAPD